MYKNFRKFNLQIKPLNTIGYATICPQNQGFQILRRWEIELLKQLHISLQAAEASESQDLTKFNVYHYHMHF